MAFQEKIAKKLKFFVIVIFLSVKGVIINPVVENYFHLRCCFHDI